ncbi:MAG: putative endonuclease related to Holliday junction resolvase [Mycobacterium sp.]|nr:putative endonuclease related to Holliday junction resolvase [Mycobacterium sp.]
MDSVAIPTTVHSRRVVAGPRPSRAGSVVPIETDRRGGPMRGKDVLGAWGEQQAATWLQQQGATVLARNWRCRAGEIDLVIAEGTCVAFVEVKTRRTETFGPPQAAVDARRQARLRRAAAAWLADHADHPELRPAPGRNGPDVRFDVVTVRPAADGEPVRVLHIPGAF